jgi:hypothetical protein
MKGIMNELTEWVKQHQVAVSFLIAGENKAQKQDVQTERQWHNRIEPRSKALNVLRGCRIAVAFG